DFLPFAIVYRQTYHWLILSRVTATISLSHQIGLANDDKATIRTRYGTTNQQHAVLFVDLDHLKVPGGHPSVAILAAHRQTLEDATRIGALPSTARVTMH